MTLLVPIDCASVSVCFVSNCNKKSELILMRHVRAYDSSCSQAITFLQPKIAKNYLKSIILGFKVIHAH